MTTNDDPDFSSDSDEISDSKLFLSFGFTIILVLVLVWAVAEGLFWLLNMVTG